MAIITRVCLITYFFPDHDLFTALLPLRANMAKPVNS
jgi:hypothetical protein